MLVLRQRRRREERGRVEGFLRDVVPAPRTLQRCAGEQKDCCKCTIDAEVQRQRERAVGGAEGREGKGDDATFEA